MKIRQWIILAGACMILILAFGLSSFFAEQKSTPDIEKAPVTKKYVATRPVIYDDHKTSMTAYGRVETAQSLDLLSEVSGRMFQGNVRLKEGQSFSKGALLYYVNNKEEVLNLKSQKSNFLRDIAAILPDMKIDYSNNFEAWRQYFSSININYDLPVLPEAKSEKEKTFLATKGIYSTFYTIKSEEAHLRKFYYYAPFAGSISAVEIESGAYVNSGTKIGTIIRTGLHELRVAVETKDIPWVQMGTAVEIYSEEMQQKWTGEVIRISDVVNQNTQSVDVFIGIHPSEQKIYAGQFIQAAIPARTVTNGMIMPRNALYNYNEVFVVEDTLLKVKEVLVHRILEDRVIISGLEEGDDVVVEPLVNGHNDMVVYKSEQKDIVLETGAPASKNSAVGVMEAN